MQNHVPVPKHFSNGRLVLTIWLSCCCACLWLILGCGNSDPISSEGSPHADAGFDRTVAVDQKVYLNAKINTGGTFSYAWSKKSGPNISFDKAASPQATFSPDETGTYVVNLTVSTASLSDSDSVTITVVEANGNNSPIANAGADRVVPPGATVELDGRASYDPDGGNLTYHWRQIGGETVVLSESENVRAAFTSPAASSSTDLIFELMVQDDQGLSETDTVTITVTPSATSQYNLATHVATGGMIVPSQGAYDEGSTVTVTATPNKGWQFDHWEGDLTGSEASATLAFDRNKYIIAVFVRSGYILTVSVEGEGSVTPNSGVYKSFTQVTLTPVPASASWKFDRWTDDLTEADNPATIIMDDDKNITAVFVSTNQVSSPAFDPPSFTEFESKVSVTITSATEGASIYYTLDGSEPSTGSTLYTDPIVLTESMTITARAYKNGMTPSAITSANYQTMMVPAG